MVTAKATADSATYSISSQRDGGSFVFCTPLLVSMVPSKIVKGVVTAAAVPAYSKWDCGVAAITRALELYGYEIYRNPHVMTTVAEKEKELVGVTEIFGEWPRKQGEDAATTLNSVLHHLLNAAYAIGAASTLAGGGIAITPVQYAAIRLQHRDVDGQVASGSLQVLHDDERIIGTSGAVCDLRAVRQSKNHRDRHHAAESADGRARKGARSQGHHHRPVVKKKGPPPPLFFLMASITSEGHLAPTGLNF